MGLTFAAVATHDRAAVTARDLLRAVRDHVGDRARYVLLHAFLGGDTEERLRADLELVDVADILRARVTVDHRTGLPVTDCETHYRTVPFADRDLKALPLVHPALLDDDVIALDLDRPTSGPIAAALWPAILGYGFFCAFTDRADNRQIMRRGTRVYTYADLKASLARLTLPLARDGIATGIVIGRRAGDSGRAVAERFDRILRDKPTLLPDLGDYFNVDPYLTAALSVLAPDEISSLPSLHQIEAASATPLEPRDGPPYPAMPLSVAGAISVAARPVASPRGPADQPSDSLPSPAATIIGINADPDHLARLPVAAARMWSRLRPMVDDPTRVVGDAALRAMLIGELEHGNRSELTLIRRIATPEKTLSLHGHPVRFLSHFDFAVQLDEIFCQQHYAFETTGSTPVIVDCGANIGLASLFFKLQHPAARIVAYEPNSVCAEVFRENMSRFGFSDVELREAAVAAADGVVTFNDCPRMPMASSVNTRMAELGYELEPRQVEAVSIARDISEGADFVKIDIEGAEYEVLPALGPLLGAVSRMFCEFHFGGVIARSALTRSLAVLDEAGLDWFLSLAQADAPSPFLNDGRKGGWLGSANLWAHPRAAPPQ